MDVEPLTKTYFLSLFMQNIKFIFMIFLDVTCLGHWPFPSANTSHPFQAVLPTSSNYLVVQDRNGIGRCLEYTYQSLDGRMTTLDVKFFDFECLDQTSVASTHLTYQGACQEALTDLSSISNSERISRQPPFPIPIIIANMIYRLFVDCC